MQARTITLTPEEQAHLEAVERRATSAARDAFRAGLILRAAAGASNEAIAAALKTRPATVSKWRGRFLVHRRDGLRDAARSGKPVRYDRETSTDSSPPTTSPLIPSSGKSKLSSKNNRNRHTLTYETSF